MVTQIGCENNLSLLGYEKDLAGIVRALILSLNNFLLGLNQKKLYIYVLVIYLLKIIYIIYYYAICSLQYTSLIKKNYFIITLYLGII